MSVGLLVDNGLRHNIVKENRHTLKFGRHVSDTPYPSSVLGCLQVMDTEYLKRATSKFKNVCIFFTCIISFILLRNFGNIVKVVKNRVAPQSQ